MSLPHPNIVFTPLTTITAQDHNNQMANVASLADGTGVNDGAIVGSKLKNSTVTADKIDFTTMPDNKYSTDEINTGKKWINGKTIYQKTFIMGGLGLATTIKKPHNISNLDMVIRIQGIAKENSIGATINLPHAADQQAYTVTVYADNTNVNIQTYADQRGYAQSYVTLWYTKK